MGKTEELIEYFYFLSYHTARDSIVEIVSSLICSTMKFLIENTFGNVNTTLTSNYLVILFA